MKSTLQVTREVLTSRSGNVSKSIDYRTSRKVEQKINFQLLKLLMDLTLGRFQRCIDACAGLIELYSPTSKQIRKLGIHLFFIVMSLLFEKNLGTLVVSFFEPSYTCRVSKHFQAGYNKLLCPWLTSQ